MILTKQQIMKELKKKRIVIDPFDEDAIGPASIDLTLDAKLRVFKKKKTVFDMQENVDYTKVTTGRTIDNGYILKPHELVLGITKEKITLPPNICGWLQSRSRFARFGLMSHVSAPFIAPGINNHQVLEIFNAGNQSVRLLPGVKVCHLILQYCKGKAVYTGRFKNQSWRISDNSTSIPSRT